jgi:hypothetical protein
MRILSSKLILIFLIISAMSFCDGAAKISYFDQIPPGLKPEKFAPGIISTNENEQNGVFSPDGKEFYFTKVTKKFEFVPYRIKVTGNDYGEAEVSDIYDAYQGGEIFISPIGDKLFFRGTISNTPPNADIFCRTKTEEGWGEPFNIGDPVNTDGVEGYPSVSRDGTLYFYAKKEDSFGKFDLYCSRYEKGEYQAPINLGSGINSPYNEFNPCISPDGSYLIFNSQDRPGNLGNGHDLYISFLEKDGSWGEAVHMGKEINSPESDYSAVVTADGKYIFFSSRRNPDKNADIFWFDAEYLKELNLHAPSPVNAKIMTPKVLLERSRSEEGDEYVGIRDITVDENSAVYAFDYMNYEIKKYNQEGKLLFTFGGSGDEDGKFKHLTGIRAVGGRILTVDSIGQSFFDYEGNFLKKAPFTKEVLTDLPAIFGDGSFVGSQILSDELKTALTYRSADGKEIYRLAFYEINEFFPGIKKGEDFFLDDTYVRAYKYALSPVGDIIWGASDILRIFRYRRGESRIVLEEKATAVPLSDDLRKSLLDRQARTKPPLYTYVPDKYQIIHHILCGSEGDIWVYVKSEEKTGFLRYSNGGKFKSMYAIDADFDMMNVLVRIFNGQMYFVVNERAGVKVYSATL